MEKEIVKEYTNGELTIEWKPKLCIHAAECVKALPEVYNPKEKPWLKIENATSEELKNQIKKCPSGALNYYVNGEKDLKLKSTSPYTKVEVSENGPLLLFGKLIVLDKEGNKTEKENTTAFCRCGESKNKPYCDGAHLKSGFKG